VHTAGDDIELEAVAFSNIAHNVIDPNGSFASGRTAAGDASRHPDQASSRATAMWMIALSPSPLRVRRSVVTGPSPSTFTLFGTVTTTGIAVAGATTVGSHVANPT